MTYQTTPHEQKVIDQFTLRRAKPRQDGKSAVATVKLYLYPDGRIYLADAGNSDVGEMYSGAKALASVGSAIMLLCERGIAHAQAYQAPDAVPDSPTF